ncbi:hypothetical protein INR49_001606 [Caranx melampygus]|nr:hypothetical protein INR49_001606 [Caranx melampygus]
MESAFLTFVLLSLFAVYSCHLGLAEWHDVVVAREGMNTTLVCTDTTVRGAVTINWKVKSHNAREWKLVLTANERKQFSGGALKKSMRLKDSNFKHTGVFSLVLSPTMEDSGLYSCMIQQKEKSPKEKIILLAILTVTVVPPLNIPLQSTLRLIARVNPEFAITKTTWLTPNGIAMESEVVPKTGTVAKLPWIQATDRGAYICMVHPWGNSSSSIFAFNVNVNVNADKVASFTNITHAEIHTATQAQTSFSIACPGVRGDYVRLHWQTPDTKRPTMKLVRHFDRWRNSNFFGKDSERLKLAGPPYNAEAGSFSFLLMPGIKDGGLYICEVFLNDNAFNQKTLLSVMKVKTSCTPSKVQLSCLYSERSQVQSAKWKHHNMSRQLRMSSNSPGTITTSVPLPITSETAGNYTCTLKLKNGQTIWAAVTLPPKVSPPPPCSLLSLLYYSWCPWLLRLLVCCYGDRNTFLIAAPPQGSVYMDLKPRGEDDVYKELERYEQCQS